MLKLKFNLQRTHAAARGISPDIIIKEEKTWRKIRRKGMNAEAGIMIQGRNMVSEEMYR